MALAEPLSTPSPERMPIDARFGAARVRHIKPFDGILFAAITGSRPSGIKRAGPARIITEVNQVVADALQDSKDNPDEVVAEAVYDTLTDASTDIVTYMDTTLQQIPIAEDLRGVLTGDIAELAVHNLLWWGVTRSKLRDQLRFARFSTTDEDRYRTPLEDVLSEGRNSNFDHLLRSETRKWKIQAKNARPPSKGQVNGEINGYQDDVIVLYASQLHRRGAKGIHEAISKDRHSELETSWARLVHELRTQKAAHGIRKII